MAKQARRPKAISGAGDLAEKAIKATGIDKLFKDGKDCGCEKRKQLLNATFPFSKPNCFNESQYNEWKAFLERFNGNTLSVADQELIVRMVRDILLINVSFCPTCSASIWKTWINKINKVYETYEN